MSTTIFSLVLLLTPTMNTFQRTTSQTVKMFLAETLKLPQMLALSQIGTVWIPMRQLTQNNHTVFWTIVQMHRQRHN
uniref:Secreted protein n=1 Tax=Arundo donax TaxID=35708 RepID=A0A0A9AQW9_ARUDO